MITKAQIYVDCTKFELKRLADECDVDVKTAINLLDIVRVSLESAHQMNKKCEMELQLLRAENKKLGMKIQPENVPKDDAKVSNNVSKSKSKDNIFIKINHTFENQPLVRKNPMRIIYLETQRGLFVLHLHVTEHPLCSYFL